MKKHLFLIIIAAMFCMPAALRAQNTVTVEVGDGSATKYSVPYNSLFNYSFVEQVYPASEIGMPTGGSIRSISFNMSSENSQTNHITVYMKNVARDKFTSETDYEPVSEADIVYSGDYTFSPSWTTITLDVPFAYNGTSNLMVAIYEDTPGYESRYFYVTDTTGASIGFHSDNYNPDPYNLDFYEGTKVVRDYRANIQLEIVPNYVQIGEGEATNNKLPSTSLYNYSLTQQIYTAAEIGKSGTINNVAFYNVGNTRTRNYDVYMLHTTKTEFSDANDWVPVTADNLVFSGTVDMISGAWTTIAFSTPFEYNGTDNLLIVIDDNTGTWQSGMNCLAFSTTANQAIHVHNDNTDYDPTSPSDYNGTTMTEKNQIQLGFDPNQHLTVYDGTDNNNFVPIQSYYADAFLKSEFVMNASELTPMVNATINGMTFYATQENISWGDASFKVFLKEVPSTTINNFTGYSDATVVYEGPLSIVNGQMAVNFTTPYAYAGGNLLVGVYNTVKGTYISCSWAGTNVTGASVQGYNYNDLDDISPTQRNFIPKTNFKYTTSGGSEGIVQIGEGDSTSSLLPSNSLWNYSLSQQIYTAAEIGRSGTIYSVAFYNAGTTKTRNYDIYMLHTTKTAFSSNADWDFADAGDLVFSGNVGMTSGEWTTIELSSPFTYNGTDNLMLVVDDNTGTWLGGLNCLVFPAQNQAIRIYGDGTNYNPANPAYNGTVLGVKNQIQLDFSPIACPTPEALSVSNVSATSASISWVETGSATNWQICVNGDGENLINVTSTNYTLTNLTPETAYNIKVRANCGGSDGTSHWKSTNFTTPPSCLAPTYLSVSNFGQTSVTLSWTENGSATAWQLCLNDDEANLISVTTNPYTLTGLTPNTNYTVKVRANCGAADGVSAWTGKKGFTTISTYQVQSTADWYGYAYNLNSAITQRFVSFTMQNPETVTYATDELYSSGTASYSSATAYANGYVWCITRNGNLTRATVDNVTKTISDFETIATEFESSTGCSMSYNPVDGKMYYLTTSKTLVSFDPNDPTGSRNQIGTFSTPYPFVLAINYNGDAYFIDQSANSALYTLNLNDASYTLVGYTGKNNYDGTFQDMAFDMQTNELFWAYSNSSDHGLYVVDPATASIDMIGQVGGSGSQIYSLFMVYNEEPICLAPTNLTVSNIGPNSAELSWNDNNGASSWQICLNDDETNLITTTTNAYTLTGLTPETSYTVKVRANCGGELGNSYWSAVRSFTTLEGCPTPENLTVENIGGNGATLSWTGFGESYTVRYRPLNIIFSDDFENGIDQWTQIDADGDGNGWVLGSAAMGAGYGHNGSADMAISKSYENSTSSPLFPDNYLVTPQITLGGQFVMWANAQDMSYPAEHFGIAVSTTGNTNATDFTMLQEWTMTAKTQGAWHQYSVDLSAYAGQQGYVAVRHFNVSDQFILNIDDIVITDTSEWQTMTVSSPNAVLTDLNPETTYEVQVQSNCGLDGNSDWCEAINFTTLENGIPAFVTITGQDGVCPGQTTTLTANTDVQATYQWSTGATTQTIEVGPGIYSVTITSSTGISMASELFTVVAAQTYEVTDTKTIYNYELPYTWNGVTFNEAGTQTVTLQTIYGCDSVVTMTLSVVVGVEDYDLTSIHLAPNPTRNVCRIIGLETAPVSVDLFDMNGKLVLRSKDTEFDVSSLRTGLYMVRVTTEDKVVNLKLIRQ